MANRDPMERLSRGRRVFGEHGGVNASVEVSTTFTVLEPGVMDDIFTGKVGPDRGGCYVYGRSFNPTVRALGTVLARLEDTEAAHPCSSGMAAISSALMSLCSSGDHIVSSNTVYGGTFALLKTFLPTKCNIHTTFADITDHEAVAAALAKPNTKVLYTETISNPTLVVADLPKLSALARSAGAQLLVDNTFTPCAVTPAHHGADIVIHSLTKFISGASDIVAGAVCGSAAFINGLMDFHQGPCMLLGPTMDPRIASELALRVPHLAIRVQEHSRRALAMAQHLQKLGAKVTYPGLPCHPQHEVLKAMINPGYGFGSLLGVDLGTARCAENFMQRLQNKHAFGFMAVSLGYFDSLMSLSAASTSSELSDEDKASSGIAGGYVRISVGITGSLEQRLTQLEEAYGFVQRYGEHPPYKAVKEVEPPVANIISWPSSGPLEDADIAVSNGLTAGHNATGLNMGAMDDSNDYGDVGEEQEEDTGSGDVEIASSAAPLPFHKPRTTAAKGGADVNGGSTRSSSMPPPSVGGAAGVSGNGAGGAVVAAAPGGVMQPGRPCLVQPLIMPRASVLVPPRTNSNTHTAANAADRIAHDDNVKFALADAAAALVTAAAAAATEAAVVDIDNGVGLEGQPGGADDSDGAARRELEGRPRKVAKRDAGPITGPNKVVYVPLLP